MSVELAMKGCKIVFFVGKKRELEKMKEKKNERDRVSKWCINGYIHGRIVQRINRIA